MPLILVRAKGFEPPRPKALRPKRSASAVPPRAQSFLCDFALPCRRLLVKSFVQGSCFFPESAHAFITEPTERCEYSVAWQSVCPAKFTFFSRHRSSILAWAYSWYPAKDSNPNPFGVGEVS